MQAILGLQCAQANTAWLLGGLRRALGPAKLGRPVFLRGSCSPPLADGFVMQWSVAKTRAAVYKARRERGVAQPGRALRSGRRGRRFESSLPDHLQTVLWSWLV